MITLGRTILRFLFFFNAIATFSVCLSPFIGSRMHQNSSTNKLFDCLSNITRTYFDRRTIYMYFNKSGTADYTAAVDSFTRAVQTPKIIMPYTSFNVVQQTKGVFAFLAEDDLYIELLNITHQSHFVAVWTKQLSMNDVRRVFRDFWGKGKHINIIGLLMMDDGTVNVYTYRPFSNYGCSKLGRPFLLDYWKNDTFWKGVDLFSNKLKTGNMLGCPIKCVGNEQPPDIVMRQNIGQQWTTSGLGGKMLEIVAKYMNFTPVITSPKGDMNEMYSWYYSADVLNNITAMLYNDEVDLAFGWYSYTTLNHDYTTELAKSTSVDCLGWAVPYRAGPRPQPWTNYVYEFDKFGWMFIGSIFVVVVG